MMIQNTFRYKSVLSFRMNSTSFLHPQGGNTCMSDSNWHTIGSADRIGGRCRRLWSGTRLTGPTAYRRRRWRRRRRRRRRTRRRYGSFICVTKRTPVNACRWQTTRLISAFILEKTGCRNVAYCKMFNTLAVF